MRRQWLAVAVSGSLVAAVKAHAKLGLPSAATTALAFATPAVIASGFKRSRGRDAAVWAGQMWAYKNAFELPYDDQRRLTSRAHLDYPILLDSRLGGGIPPGRRLQRRLRRRGSLNVLDKALSFFYWTWEAEPHLVMGWLRWCRPASFPSAAGRLAATFDLTLLAYWAVPTAPPWWASEKAERMEGEVRRVMAEVASWIKRDPHPTDGDHEMGANPFAAMPSDHFASASMTAMLLAEQDWRLGVIGWSYAVALGMALVYLGEHYVSDLLAGLALALVVNRAREPLERVAERVLAMGPSR